MATVSRVVPGSEFQRVLVATPPWSLVLWGSQSSPPSPDRPSLLPQAVHTGLWTTCVHSDAHTCVLTDWGMNALGAGVCHLSRGRKVAASVLSIVDGDLNGVGSPGTGRESWALRWLLQRDRAAGLVVYYLLFGIYVYYVFIRFFFF